MRLSGRSLEPPSPFDHQTKARDELEQALDRSNGGTPAALIVLPTGAGKTFVALDWLLRRMEASERPRVLWVVHQKMLVDQAVRAAEDAARWRAVGFERVAKAVHSDASGSSALADPDVDFVAITWQTLYAVHRKQLQKWFARPCYVVADEAHHAGGEKFDLALRRCKRYKNFRGLIGLTATPRPASERARRAVARHFPRGITYQSTVTELIKSGVLARPRFYAVRTGVLSDVDEAEERRLVRGAEPSGVVLFTLASDADRNRVIVDEYANEPARWGKAIIFTINIEMAEDVGELIRERDLECAVVHSGSDADPREESLDWFENSPGQACLIAVSMLSEGVDIPSAQTAFIARPTNNRTLLKQMVGRVLRGVPAGGGAEANVVDSATTGPAWLRSSGRRRRSTSTSGSRRPRSKQGR